MVTFSQLPKSDYERKVLDFVQLKMFIWEIILHVEYQLVILWSCVFASRIQDRKITTGLGH